MVWQNGAKYKGYWLTGKRDGIGEHVFPNGEKYSGGWKKGKRNGKGIRVFTNNDSFEGTWNDDKKHGPGVYIHAHGRQTKQLWDNGKLTSNNVPQDPQSLVVLCIEFLGRRNDIPKQQIDYLPIELKENLLFFKKNDEKFRSPLLRFIQEAFFGRFSNQISDS